MNDDDFSSSLSSLPSSDDEGQPGGFGLDGANDAQKSTSLSPAPSSDESDAKDRPPSPPHEQVLADNPDIAFIVMFRSRFNDAFTTKLAHFGPQDIERGVVDPVPSPQVESLLCALLGLVLNRKKPVERGHYGRALEEAILAQKSQWPRAWNGQNPLSGGRTFTSMDPAEKLTLLKTLIFWALHASETVSNIVKESYKQSRGQFDLNQPLAVQPWGADGRGWVYWLIEGQDDTSFRIYTERNITRPGHEWRSVAGSIEDMQEIAKKLKADKHQAARRLAERIERSIPRFEATEEKRKRREYRLARRAQFTRPEPGFSLYEGRTRGKRMRYTFEEEEDEYTSDVSTRRSMRNSGIATPSEPTVTASGRQVRPRMGSRYVETGPDGTDSANRDTPASAEYERSDKSEDPPGPPPDANVKYFKPKGRGWKGWAIAEDTGESSGAIHDYNEVDAMDEDEDEAMSSGESAGEWDGGDDESDVIRARDADDEDENMDDEDSGDDLAQEPQSLIVTLKYGKRSIAPSTQPQQPTPVSQPESSSALDNGAQPTLPKLSAMSNGVSNAPNGAPAVQPEFKPEVAPVQAPPPSIKLATHPSPTKVTATPVQPAAPPAMASPYVPPVVSLPLTNGSLAPQQYKQQTVDSFFVRPAASPSNDAGKSDLPGASVPPVTST